MSFVEPENTTDCSGRFRGNEMSASKKMADPVSALGNIVVSTSSQSSREFIVTSKSEKDSDLEVDGEADLPDAVTVKYYSSDHEDSNWVFDEDCFSAWKEKVCLSDLQAAFAEEDLNVVLINEKEVSFYY